MFANGGESQRSKPTHAATDAHPAVKKNQMKEFSFTRLGKNILAIRTRLKLTQLDFAALFDHVPGSGDTRRSNVSLYEAGKRRRFHNVLEVLGFDTKLYNVYSWKHSGAVDCVKAGISIKELQLQLRHHSLDQVDEYLRQLGLIDLMGLKTNFPKIGNQ